jgi:nodulation protein E
VIRVAVTGLGCVTPIGNTPADFREALFAGRSGITEFDPAFPGSLSEDPGLRFRTWARVSSFNPADHFTTGIISIAGPGAQFGMVAARQAAAESRLFEHYPRESIAVVTGCSCGGRDADEEAARHLYTRDARVPPTTILRTMANSGTSNIAIDLGLGGAVFNVSTACASGTHALGLAFHMVRSGMAPAALAGGYEGALTFGFLRAWESMRVVSPTRCRPFAADRDGMTLGEGAAMLALEPLESALARGAHIYAEIVGFGMSADAHHITQPRAEGAALAIRRALEDAAVTLGESPSNTRVPHSSQPHRDQWDGRTSSSTLQAGVPHSSRSDGSGEQNPDPPTLAHRVGYINAHATGTLTNDPVEAAAIHQALGEHAAHIPVSGTKSLHGHSIGAVGAIEALATILALDTGTLPHTANITTVDPTLNLDIITGRPRPLAPDKDLALTNSLAFGGLNAVLALRRYQP